MTPHGGPLDERYWRDVARGCVYILLPMGLLLVLMVWVLTGIPF
jgi:K+-transporting ATPase A subunit